MKVVLNDYVEIVNERVDISEADSNSYVSTDNLLPNRGGVDFPAKNLPKTRYVQTYKRKDILISNIRPYFKKIWLASESGTKSNDVLCFRTKNRMLLQEYLYVVLQSDNFFDYVTRTSKGTKMPRGDKDAIKQYQFDLPDLEEQFKIANSILILENKIKLNKAINDNLSKFRELLYMRLIQSSDVKEVKLTELFNIAYGKNIAKSELTKSGTKVFGANGLIGYTQKPSIISAPTVTITSRGSGSGYVSYLNIGNAFLTNNLLYLNENKNLGLSFSYETIKSANPKQFVTGSAQPQLTIKNLSQSLVKIPSDINLVNKFRRQMYPIEEIIKHNSFENEKLEMLKNTLLNKCF